MSELAGFDRFVNRGLDVAGSDHIDPQGLRIEDQVIDPILDDVDLIRGPFFGFLDFGVLMIAFIGQHGINVPQAIWVPIIEDLEIILFVEIDLMIDPLRVVFLIEGEGAVDGIIPIHLGDQIDRRGLIIGLPIFGRNRGEILRIIDAWDPGVFRFGRRREQGASSKQWGDYEAEREFPKFHGKSPIEAKDSTQSDILQKVAEYFLDS